MKLASSLLLAMAATAIAQVRDEMLGGDAEAPAAG